MKKLKFAVLILVSIAANISCENDDTNEIDFIIPNDDTTETGVTKKLN